jgi:hypothetical protein
MFRCKYNTSPSALFLVPYCNYMGQGERFEKFVAFRNDIKWRYLTSRNRFQCHGRSHGKYDCRRSRKRGSMYFEFIYFLQKFFLTSETWASDVSAYEKYVHTDILNENSAFTSGYSRIVAYPVKGCRTWSETSVLKCSNLHNIIWQRQAFLWKVM